LTVKKSFINLNKRSGILALTLIMLAVLSVVMVNAPVAKAQGFPSIQLNPVSGRVGTLVTVTGTGFTPGGRVGVGLGSANPITSADGSGGIFTTFNVPNLSAGQYNVQAGDQETGYVAYAAFTVLASTLGVSVKPNQGQVGTTVVITGSGFTPSTAVTLKFGSNKLATTTASASGDIIYQANIPNNPAGDYTITATDSKGGTATTTFTIRTGTTPTESPSGSPTPSGSGSPTPTPPTSTGTITLSPSQGKAGALITASGYGFTPNSLIGINLGGSQVAMPYADGFGSISTQFTVPAGMAAGTYAVSAYDASSGGQATTQFIVTAEGSSQGGFFSPLVIGIIVAVVVAVLIPLTFVATRRRGGGKSREGAAGYDESRPGQYPPPAPGQYPPSQYSQGQYPPPPGPPSRQPYGQSSYGGGPSSGSAYGSSYRPSASAAGRGGGQRFQCPYCGRPLDASARICPRCGKRVERPRAQYSFEGNLGL